MVGNERFVDDSCVVRRDRRNAGEHLRVLAPSELLLRAPPRYATRWKTHEKNPVHDRHAGTLLYNMHGPYVACERLEAASDSKQKKQAIILV